MAYGNLISDGVEIASGTYGSVYSFNTREMLASDIQSLMMQDAGVMSAPATISADLSTLFTYLESATAPDFAYYFTANILYIFINVATYDSASRFGFTALRDALKYSSVGDSLDIPPSWFDLMILLVKNQLKEDSEHRIGYDLEQKIITEKARLEIS